MSAVAGRVLLIPKGSYNSGITYNMLDVVTYEYDSYVAKTTTIGHDPTDTTYWQKMTDVGDDVNSLKETFTKNGAHNLLPMTLASIKPLNTSGTWSGNTYTQNGVTYTIDTDTDGNIMGITANGTATGSHSGLYVTNFVPPTGHYIKTGCPSGGSANTYVFGGSSGNETGNGLDYYSDGSTMKAYVIAIISGYTANNLVFKPMLRLASDTDSTFAPYAMTNRELTQAKLDVTQLKTVVAASSDFADFKTRIAAL